MANSEETNSELPSKVDPAGGEAPEPESQNWSWGGFDERSIQRRKLTRLMLLLVHAERESEK